MRFTDEQVEDERQEYTGGIASIPNYLVLDIHGVPISGSQLKFNRKTGHAYRPTEHTQRVYTIYQYALQYIADKGLPRPVYRKGVPLSISVEFRFPYRQGDYRTGKHAGELKPNRDRYVIGNKDLDNMLKPLKDGLKGVIYADDNQIAVYGNVSKEYSEHPGTTLS